jgi:hypothetical protein
MQYIIMCRSLTYAQRAEAALSRAGITAAVSRAPQELSGGGCGYCVKVAQRRFQSALSIMAEKGIAYGRLFRVNEDGSYTEVSGHDLP